MIVAQRNNIRSFERPKIHVLLGKKFRFQFDLSKNDPINRIKIIKIIALIE
jgi:hypothetical protein